MNWFAVTVIGIWFAAAIGSWRTRDWLPFFAAMMVTLAMGWGYLMISSR